MKYSCSTLYVPQIVPVKHGYLGRDHNSDLKIIKYFLDFKNEGNGIPATNSTGWKTDWYAHQDHSEILSPLLDTIHLWYCNNVVGARGPKFITDYAFQNTNNLHIDANVWFQEYLPGQTSPQHDHGTLARYSWVYYMSVDKNPSPLTFVTLGDKKGELEVVDEISCPVYNGMIIMFPSFMQHKVYPCDTLRYVLAGNINDIEYKEQQ